MSLNWQFGTEKIKAPCVDSKGNIPEKYWPRANCLIYGTMTIGLGELNEKTLPEWLFRQEILRQMGDSLGESDKGKWYPTAEELKLFMPMHTNVTPLTRIQWLKRIGEILGDRATRNLKKMPGYSDGTEG